MDDDGPAGDLTQLLTTLRNSRGPARIRSAARGALPRAAAQASLAEKLEVVDLATAMMSAPDAPLDCRHAAVDVLCLLLDSVGGREASRVAERLVEGPDGDAFDDELEALLDAAEVGGGPSCDGVHASVLGLALRVAGGELPGSATMELFGGRVPAAVDALLSVMVMPAAPLGVRAAAAATLRRAADADAHFAAAASDAAGAIDPSRPTRRGRRRARAGAGSGGGSAAPSMGNLSDRLVERRASLAAVLLEPARHALRTMRASVAPLLAVGCLSGGGIAGSAIGRAGAGPVPGRLNATTPQRKGATGRGAVVDGDEDEDEDEAAERAHVHQLAASALGLLNELLRGSGPRAARTILSALSSADGEALCRDVALPFLALCLDEAETSASARGGAAGSDPSGRAARSLAVALTFCATAALRCRGQRGALGDVETLARCAAVLPKGAQWAVSPLLRLCINTDALGSGAEGEATTAAPGVAAGPGGSAGLPLAVPAASSAPAPGGAPGAGRAAALLKGFASPPGGSPFPAGALRSGGPTQASTPSLERRRALAAVDAEDDDEGGVVAAASGALWEPSPHQSALLRSLRAAVLALSDADWHTVSAVLLSADPALPVFRGCPSFARLAFAHEATHRRVEAMSADLLAGDDEGAASPSEGGTPSFVPHGDRAPPTTEHEPPSDADPEAEAASPAGRALADAAASPGGSPAPALPPQQGLPPAAALPHLAGSPGTGIGGRGGSAARAPHHLPPMAGGLGRLRGAAAALPAGGPGAAASLVRPSQDLLCPFSGQAMLDPVETPSGFVCDAASLAGWMLARGGRQERPGDAGVVGPDPLTAEPCAIADCKPRRDLQSRVEEWLRRTAVRG
uniref:U-box domain-containing protein n=1 Tax=Cafeteria roenbergensis TaxID=33653 RepID=A0A7S0JNS1_CAFRO|mmetsp:Transcript_11736/g.45749  ORF Transcript_11736/g.45749 Transcript_11736/m.45749 type:complete len:860 (+) Transcript_11736:81-2660(+)